MKIEQGPFQAISQLEPQYKEKALAGRFYHTKRTFLVKTQDDYLAVTFTIFERIKAAFLKIIGKDYFSDVLKAKSVTFVTNNELAKIVPIPAQAAPAVIPKALPPGVQAQAAVALAAPAVAAPVAGTQAQIPVALPAQNAVPAAAHVAGTQAQAPVILPAPAAVPAAGTHAQIPVVLPAQNAVLAAAPAAGTHAQIPVALPAQNAVPAAAPVAGTQAQAPVILPAPATAPAAGTLVQAPAAAAPAPVQPLAALPAVPVVVPQAGLSQDVERIVKRGLPFAGSPRGLELLIPEFDNYMKNRRYQETMFRNTSSDVTLVGDRDFYNMDLNNLQMFLRLLLLNGRIAAYAPHRSGYGIFEKQEQIVWEKAELYRPEMVITKAKLLEMDQHMNQVRFPQPPAEFSDAQKTRFQVITKLIEETQFQRIKHKTSKAGEAWELNEKLSGSKEVMDFLVKTNVIHAWNHFSVPSNNNLIVKFAQTDVWKDGASAIGQTWRDAALIQREENFQRTHRIEIPANADLSQFKPAEQERLKKIVDLLNKRVAFGQPAALERQMMDDKLLTWLRDQKHIVGFEAAHFNAPFRIYVTEEDRKH